MGFAAILSRSELCATASYAQGAENYTDVKGRPSSFSSAHWYDELLSYCLSPSCTVYLPDTTKRVPQIVTAFDWCWFCYFLRHSLIALLEALFARIFLDLRYRCAEFFYFFRPGLSLTKPLPPLLPTRLLCLVVAIPLVCWLYMCACVCVPLYVHVKMCR